jgi:hypothetical protein
MIHQQAPRNQPMLRCSEGKIREDAACRRVPQKTPKQAAHAGMLRRNERSKRHMWASWGEKFRATDRCIDVSAGNSLLEANLLSDRFGQLLQHLLVLHQQSFDQIQIALNASEPLPVFIEM